MKHGHRALWSRSLGVRADSTVGGQRGHADPNAVKNINVALAAVARNRSPRFVGAETYAPVRPFSAPQIETQNFCGAGRHSEQLSACCG